MLVLARDAVMLSLVNKPIDLLADLIRINSVNPNYGGGVPEAAIADYVEGFFRRRNIETMRREIFPDRPNIIARLPGRDPNRRIVLEAHMDTVSTDGMESDPWEPVVRDGNIYGRGACDTKGGMAAMMTAIASIAAERSTPACDVLFAAVIDLVRFKIETRGRSAHSAKPHLGVNAIDQMAIVVNALREDTRQLGETTHPLLGPATCNVGVIRGGVQINLVPASCEIEVDRRLLPRESLELVLKHYRQLLDRLLDEHPDMHAVMHEPLLTDVPLETDRGSPAVETIVSVLSSLGLDSIPTGVAFCSDASKFGAIGIPSIILGPGSIDQAMNRVAAISRRRFMETATAAATVAALSHQAQADAKKSGWIDAHVHVWTPDVAKYPLAEGFKIADMQPVSFTPAQLFQHTRPVGVDRIVLIQMSFYRFDNRYMLDVMAAHPGVFSGVAIVDHRAADVATRMKELAGHGVRGFRIHARGEAAAGWVTDDGMATLWKTARAENLAVCPLINPTDLTHIDALCKRFPGTRVVVDHFARVGISGQINQQHLDALCRLARFPDVHVKTSAFYALGRKQPPYEDLTPMIRRVVDAYGPSRLMWASDCPYQVQGEHSYEASIALIRDQIGFLSDDDREWMLRGTAEKVFFG